MRPGERGPTTRTKPCGQPGQGGKSDQLATIVVQLIGRFALCQRHEVSQGRHGVMCDTKHAIPNPRRHLRKS